MNFLIPTLMLWIINALLVMPLAQKWTLKAANIPQGADIKNLGEETQRKIKRILVRKYIIMDIIILGIAGFIGGLLGYFFVGVSFEAKGWPGMVAFILASFIGFSAKGGTV